MGRSAEATVIRQTTSHQDSYASPVTRVSSVSIAIKVRGSPRQRCRGSSSEGIAMATQGLQLDTPVSRVPEHRRSKKLVPLIASAAVLVILAAIGVYYVAFRSLPTTVSWAPSVSAIAPGGGSPSLVGSLLPRVVGWSHSRVRQAHKDHGSPCLSPPPRIAVAGSPSPSSLSSPG